MNARLWPLAAAHDSLPPPSHSAALLSVALWYIAISPGGHRNMLFWVISQYPRLRIAVRLDYSLVHGPDLCRWLMPSPKFGRSRPTTAAAAPATFRMVHLKVVGRQQMAIAADTGYHHGLGDTFRREGHDMTFACSKARPRYQFCTSLIYFTILIQTCFGRARVLVPSKPSIARYTQIYICV
jgi:hypothetical protein